MTPTEWEFGLRFLDGLRDSDAVVCAFRASLTMQSTKRLQTASRIRRPVHGYRTVPSDMPCILPCCDSLLHRRVYSETADGGFFPARRACRLHTYLVACTLQEGERQ